MIAVTLSTTRWSPRSGHQVTVRTSARDWTDVPGLYLGGQWHFALPEQPQQFKFVLDAAEWERGPDREAVPGAPAGYEEVQVDFAVPRLVAEAGAVARELIPTARGDRHYDVIVVGSGMGGGVLADELADLGRDVLVLEAGSYLFPTHVANLPREHRVGVFSKHVWELFDRFKVVNYTQTPGSEYFGAQAYNLGGRSVFWGGLIPRLGAWELQGWPAAVRDDLLGGRFAAAEDLMNSTRPASEVQTEVLAALSGLLPDHHHRDAPVAVQYTGVTSLSVPAGMFSTADLLLESLLTIDTEKARRPTVNLNHEVRGLETANGRVTAVRCADLVAGVERTFHADVVVLAAGTVESATLALASELADPDDLVGRGITDHPVWFAHFGLPPTSPFAGGGSAKTWSWPLDAGSAAGQYNLVLEIGSDFNQNRFIDDDTLQRHLEERDQVGLGEVVLLFNTPLVEANRLTLAPTGRPEVTMARAPVAPEAEQRARKAAADVLGMIGAVPLPGEGLDLQPAPLGAVAHEVGTLRMGEDGGVVTPDLRFRGYENLYVCDLSVFPSSPAGNPSLTLVALAHRLARRLAAG
jgi:choline dehydrogenase-like flavoprotein